MNNHDRYMHIKEIMHDTTVVTPETSVVELSRMMRDKTIGSVLVHVSDRKYGIITERDILSRVIAGGLDPSSAKASDIMTELRYTIDANASIQEASEIFNTQRIRRLPVVENGKIIGIITTRDVAKKWQYNYFTTKQRYAGASRVR